MSLLDITPELCYLSMCSAGVAQWQSGGFPSRYCGFDSRHPLQNNSIPYEIEYKKSVCISTDALFVLEYSQMQEAVDLAQQDEEHAQGHDVLHAEAEEAVDLGIAALVEFV